MHDRIGGKTCEIEQVPIDYFLGFVSKATGWDEEELLKSKDIGDIEYKLNIRAERPIQTLSTKRGKSKNDLYRFMDDDEKEELYKSIEKIIGI